ncbi:MAG: UDP-phosphate galactose phosphotransferase [Anaerolineales bacterium]|nr:sugar transferase [Anaerolineae bacterium]PWB51808.1 MAG: UDP-phosphate galactose phosphotransferase [Anaerolineales bacterium]
MDYVIIKQPRLMPRSGIYHKIKRLIDIGVCLAMLPVIIPIMLFCAIAILLDSPGPILFVQERLGKGGRLFKMYKFRTMRTDIDQRHVQDYMRAYVRSEIITLEDGRKTFKPASDQAFFPFGRLLRKLSLDELPQIINVLKGEMSIVGPRPNVLWEVEAYRPWHYERMEVLPGITGLAQVRGRSSIDFAHLVRNDIEYIEKQSLSLDLKIMWWTFISALTGKGAA